MKLPVFTFLLLACLPFIGLAQTPTFNEANYSLQGQGMDSSNNLFVKTYRSTIDANYTLKKVFLDSTYTKLLSKSYFKIDTLDGPFVIYDDGQLALSGQYKSGIWDGERLTYVGAQIVQKAYFREGIPTGTWENYRRSGQLFSRVTYDAEGNVASEEKF